VADKQRRNYLLLLGACLAIALFCLAYPFYVIRPFRHQGLRELAAALAILRFRPGVEILCGVTAALAGILYWRLQPKLLRRIAALAGAAAVFLCAGLSRANMYEIMFHPLGRPSFATSRETKLDPDEKVIAVNLRGDSRAYPIRVISYHHIVNDVVGGLPIVATY
jgi:hypothetical protein